MSKFYIITTLLIIGSMSILTLLLFLMQRVMNRHGRPQRKEGWMILDNREYVTFSKEER